MKKFTLAAFLFVFTFFLTNCEDSVPPNYDEIPVLHQKWPFFVGAAAPGSAFSSSDRQYPLLRFFNVLVAENDMKPDSFIPGNFGNADKLVNYAEANGIKARGHVLFWHNQTPASFFQGSGTGGRATKAELYERMESHAKRVFEHYRGRIGWWDVCNEVVDDSGSGSRTNSPYTQIMQDSGLTGIDRYEYVLKAFQWARQYADENGGQNVKLYLNDYNIEHSSSSSGSKQPAFEALIDYLIQNDAPIDGVGLQCHIQYQWPSVNDISSAIDKFSGKTRKDGVKLMTQVTELDMTLFDWPETQSGKKTLSSGELNTRLPMQTRKYRDLFDMFKKKYDEGKLDMVLVWGLADGHSWLNSSNVQGRTDYPLLFDRKYKPKDAYWELVK